MYLGFSIQSDIVKENNGTLNSAQYMCKQNNECEYFIFTNFHYLPGIAVTGCGVYIITCLVLQNPKKKHKNNN